MAWRAARDALVDNLVSQGILHTPRVIAAMRAVPRHAFLAPEDADVAYEDHPVAIGHGATISAPHMVAIMSEMLEVGPGQRVLEIGTGSGYQAAVLAHLAPGGHVCTLEREAALAAQARTHLAAHDWPARLEVIDADGTLGWPRGAPFDRILVTAGAPRVPQPLVTQLARRGRLIVPVGALEAQVVVQVDKAADGAISRSQDWQVRFVPLIGTFGWSRESADAFAPPR